MSLPLGNIQPCNSVTSKMTRVFLISTLSRSHTFIQLLWLGCVIVAGIFKTSGIKLHPPPAVRELLSYTFGVYGVHWWQKQVIWPWGSHASFTENRCCVIGFVVQGMKTSGTPHVTRHHCAEDQIPLFFIIIIYMFIQSQNGNNVYWSACSWFFSLKLLVVLLIQLPCV